jgi:hypothetical protein
MRAAKRRLKLAVPGGRTGRHPRASSFVSQSIDSRNIFQFQRINLNFSTNS